MNLQTLHEFMVHLLS